MPCGERNPTALTVGEDLDGHAAAQSSRHHVDGEVAQWPILPAVRRGEVVAGQVDEEVPVAGQQGE
ncbi:hypothetical protein [Nocardia neocaledoniensis]|uniref:hypothetical protein n=1 Tax=Nocardia neocaledoniensis TaxID=236511 RepID=UPI0024554FCB|nr:hypothetical protein [Nocardia neocaledoniensis]